MIICIIAGGSGTRLWPLSTSSYPKHLLKVNGDDKSLLQNTYERARTLSDSIYVITDASHAHHIKEQLPELKEENFVIEPARRGTASCYLAAISHVKKYHDENEAIAMLSADHFIRDTVGFTHSFKLAGETSEASGRIVLVGVEPDHPATGFGYIQKDGIFDEESLVYDVHSFKEKPDYDTALKFMKSGQYLWNCGYFVGSAKTFSDKMQSSAPSLFENLGKLNATADQSEFEKIYLGFENDAIEFALMEKLNDLLVVPATFDWMDVGSYTDLHKAVGGDEAGNYIGKGDVEVLDVENSYIENYEDKPLAVIGLDNVVVINTKEGLVVARKDLGQKVGEVAKRIAARES